MRHLPGWSHPCSMVGLMWIQPSLRFSPLRETRVGIASCRPASSTAPGASRVFGHALRVLALAWVGLLCIGVLSAHGQTPTRSGAWAIQGATVWTGGGEEPLVDGVVVVDQGMIRCAGPRNRCSTHGLTSVIDGRGLWVVPGLIDVDASLRWTVDSTQAQNDQHVRFAVGITHVREAGSGGEVQSNLRAQDRATDPFRPEPRVVVTGALVPGNLHEFGASGMVDLANDLARQRVDALRVGAMTSAQLDSVARIGRAWSIPVLGGAEVGSVEDRIRLMERGALRSAHGIGFASTEAVWLDSLATRGVALPGALVAARFADGPVPHLDSLGFLDGPGDWGDLLPVVPSQRERRLRKARGQDDVEYAHVVTKLERYLDRGGRMLVSGGTAPAGSGLHRELGLLQEAGFAPAELLSLVTEGAARELEIERRYGAVRTGYVADLLILEGDPTADVGNLQHLWRVVKGGVIHDPDQLLEPFRVRAARLEQEAWKERRGILGWFALGLTLLLAFGVYRVKYKVRF